MPSMSTGPVRGVPIRSVPPMSVLESQRERFRPARKDHKVYVIGHEAVAEQR